MPERVDVGRPVDPGPATARRRCAATTTDGRACAAAPARGGRFCRLHDPDQAGEVAEARRLGGLRRRRERTIHEAYDLGELDNVDDIRRLLVIVRADALGLDNSPARLRVLLGTAGHATRLIALEDVVRRLEALEASLALPPGTKYGRRLGGPSLLDRGP